MGKNHLDRTHYNKLPPWDQASAEFYFARSRDLLTKAMTQVPSWRGNRYETENRGVKKYEESSNNGLNGLQSSKRSFSKESKRTSNGLESMLDANPLLGDYYGKAYKYKKKNDVPNNSNDKTQKTNNINPSSEKEVPSTTPEVPHHQSNPVTLRKCGSKGHLRRRSYNDRYLSSTSSDSSDSCNLSEADKQMSYRLKMRKQRRGGSFSNAHAMSQMKNPQTLLNSPPPQNSFLNSIITSPKNNNNNSSNTSDKSKFFVSNLKPAKSESVQNRSLNNLSKSNNFLPFPGFDEKWPRDVAKDSSSLTFTSSNSSSLNWEEYLELDREFLSCSNCPPSPAPQV